MQLTKGCIWVKINNFVVNEKENVLTLQKILWNGYMRPHRVREYTKIDDNHLDDESITTTWQATKEKEEKIRL